MGVKASKRFKIQEISDPDKIKYRTDLPFRVVVPSSMLTDQIYKLMQSPAR